MTFHTNRVLGRQFTCIVKTFCEKKKRKKKKKEQTVVCYKFCLALKELSYFFIIYFHYYFLIDLRMHGCSNN